MHVKGFARAPKAVRTPQSELSAVRLPVAPTSAAPAQAFRYDLRVYRLISSLEQASTLGTIFSPFSRWETRDREIKTSFPKVTEPRRGRAKVQTQLSWSLSSPWPANL